MEVRHPHVTVRRRDGMYEPVLMMLGRSDLMQASDVRPGEEDEARARQVARAWAEELRVPYEVST